MRFTGDPPQSTTTITGLNTITTANNDPDEPGATASDIIGANTATNDGQVNPVSPRHCATKANLHPDSSYPP